MTYQDLTPEEHLTRLQAAGLPKGQAEFVVALDGNTRDGLLGLITGELSATIGRPTTRLDKTLETI